MQRGAALNRRWLFKFPTGLIASNSPEGLLAALSADYPWVAALWIALELLEARTGRLLQPSKRCKGGLLTGSNSLISLFDRSEAQTE